MLLAREPFHIAARDIWDAHHQGEFEAFLSPITPVNVFHTLALPFNDFEDAVQTAATVASGLDGIVTRNLADYVGATIAVYSPPDFLNLLAAPGNRQG